MREKEPLDVKIEFGEVVFEELELCDHGADAQIKGRMPAADSQALLSRPAGALWLSVRRADRGWRR
jgi:hypothetical protein